MKKVMIIMSVFTALNANTMSIAVSNLAPRAVVLSAIAHTSLAYGLLGNPIREIAVVEFDGEMSLPKTGTSFSYLNTMVSGGNDVQVSNTKKMSRAELKPLVLLSSAPFAWKSPREKDEIKVQEGLENQPILYVIFRKNLSERLAVAARLAAKLGHKLKDNASKILSSYEDVDGDVISVASKYPFMALEARNQGQLDELATILSGREYPYVNEDGAIAFMNMEGDKSITKKFSLAK